MYKENEKMLSVSDCVAVEKPDFARILEHLQKEVSYNQENAVMLSGLTNSIKPMEDRPMNKELASKSPNCLVDYLWQEIHRLQISNQDINEVIQHLTKVIGNYQPQPCS